MKNELENLSSPEIIGAEQSYSRNNTSILSGRGTQSLFKKQGTGQQSQGSMTSSAQVTEGNMVASGRQATNTQFKTLMA